METVGTISNAVAAYMQRTATSDFNINSNIDILYLALNNARRVAERAHDFFFSEIDVTLSIGSTGASLASAYIDTTATAAGTLSPNVAGAFALTGVYNGLPFYTKTVTGTVYFLSYSGTAWTVTAVGFTIGADYWGLTTVSSNPAGSYAPHGAYTGTLTITQNTGTIAIKTIQNVLLPVAESGHFPIEFLMNNEWNKRVLRQVGREIYNPAKTLEEIGVYTTNPVAYQQAQTLTLVPPNNTFTFPVLARLSVIRWLADYTATTDTDFIIQRAPDYMLWGALLEVNKFFRNFAPRQEGQLDEEAVTAERDASLQALIAWDVSIAESSTTPVGQGQPS